METEKVPVAWFEFLLNPTILEDHLKEESPDPSPIDLIIQFIFNGMKRIENAACEGEIADSATQKITDKMKHVLTVLPLQVAAHLNWDLNLFQQKLPLHIQDSLLVALLHETLDELCNPATHTNLDTGPLLPHQLFSIALYHRYALSALVKAKLPSKPPKVSNVPIPGQQDPLHESREVHDGIIVALERGAEVSIRILEQLLTAGLVRCPAVQSFSTTNKNLTAGESPHFWHRCHLVPDEQFKYQIHYDLANYHFLQEQFSDALHHVTEALQLVPEVGSCPTYCRLEEGKLQGFYRSCSAICGRATPVAKRSLYDKFSHALATNFEGLLEVLAEDNIKAEIPFYLRQTLQLDLMTKQEKLPDGFVFHVQTLNTVGDVLAGRCWNNMYPVYLLQAGKEGAQYLVQLLGSKLTVYSPFQRQQIRSFVETLAQCEGQREALISQLMTCAPLASLFTHEEIVVLWPGTDGKGAKGNKRVFDASLGSDPTNINDLIWDLIHSYNPQILEKTFKCYLNVQPLRPGFLKKDVLNLNTKWEGVIPIPVRNTIMKLMNDPHKGLVLLYIAKSQELTLAKSFQLALGLLSEASSLLRKFLTKDFSRPCKMLKWMTLTTRIQQQIYELPCVEESEIRNLTVESKQCLSALSSTREMVVPWTNIINWSILLLLNAQDWPSLLGSMSPVSSHFPIMHLLKPLAAAAQSLQDKLTNKKPWQELFEIVSDILVGSTPYRDQPLLSRSGLLELVESVKEPRCLSLLISLLGHLVNMKTLDPSNAIHIDHLLMWPSKYNGIDFLDSVILKEVLSSVVDHATMLYSSGAHTNTTLCSSWFLTKADLAYNQKAYRKAIQNYLTAIFVATNYLRNDTNNPDQNAMSDTVLRRMIGSCMALESYTQAAILCQFLESIDYNTAIGCLQERNAIDGMDAYYNCLYDVTLMEFIINLHQKKGEVQRRDKVMRIIGLLEINSNNNEEIQREAAKVRKHRFLRAMGKQYLL